MKIKKEKRKDVGVNFSSGAEKVENISEKGEREVATAHSLYGAETTGGFVENRLGQNLNDPLLFGVINNEKLNGVGQQKTEKDIIEKKRGAVNQSHVVKMLNERRREKARKAEKERLLAERRISAAKRKQERKQARNLSHGGGSSGGGKNNRRDNGTGGWIAAVSVLGATTLGLGAVVTVGAIEMRDTRQGIASAYQGDLYELIALVEYADSDLDRVRVSNSPAQQSRILTDLLLQTRLAESVLEKMPIDAQSNGNLTAFLNRTSALCERLLSKLRAGQPLDETDQASIQRAYEINRKTRGILDGLIGKYEDRDWLEYLKGKGEDDMTLALRELEDATLDENNVNPNAIPDVRAGATPKDAEEKKITSSKAEDLCRAYFSDYKIKSIEFQGETVSKKMQAYNFLLKDEKGLLLHAQLSEKNGELISFDYYEHCVEHNFDLDNAKTIAENFLNKLGLEDMTAVKVNEMGATASFTFVYEQDDVIYYPDSVEVKVCEQKGIVVGYNGSAYLKRHKNRAGIAASISMSEARANLSEKLSVENGRTALISTRRGERLAYEFICSYDGQRYFVYVDAQTGEELSILNIGQAKE
ncbi:MAG: germination protein YpeB [Clostridia bacterium]|nr:germination protein YpeB [Clostridia bacterium]